MWVKTASLSALTGDVIYIAGFGSSATGAFAGLMTDEFQTIYTAEWSDSGTNGQYANGFNYTTNGWTCVVGLLQYTGKQAHYTNVSTSPSTLSQGANGQNDPASFDNLYVGWQTSLTGFGPPTATNLISVAEIAFWRGTLGSAEALALFSGANPSTINPTNLYAYYPLRGNLNDYGPQHIGLAPVGGAVATFVDHPNVAPITSTRFRGSTILPITGTIAATTKKPTTSITGTETFSGTITPTTKKAVTSIAGTETFTGTITPTTKKPTTSITATERFSATIASSTKKVTSTVAGSELFSGTIATTGKKVTSSVSGSEIFSGTVTSSTKKVSTSITGLSKFSGTIAATTRKPTTNLNGFQGNTFLGTITASTKKVTTAFSGLNTLPGTIITFTKKPDTTITVQEIFSATIASSTKKASTSINSNTVNIGSISAGTKKASTSVNGGQLFTGSLVSNGKKVTTDFEFTISGGANAGSINSLTKKAITSISATTGQTPPFNAPLLIMVS